MKRNETNTGMQKSKRQQTDRLWETVG